MREIIEEANNLSRDLLDIVEKFRRKACGSKWCEIEFRLMFKDEPVIFKRHPYTENIEIIYTNRGIHILFADWAHPKILVFEGTKMVKETRIDIEDERMRDFQTDFIHRILQETKLFSETVLIPYIKERATI